MNQLAEQFLDRTHAQSELVIGLVAPVGTELDKVMTELEQQLSNCGYEPIVVHISKDLIPVLAKGVVRTPDREFDRIESLMDLGNKARRDSKDNAILALGVAGIIAAGRGEDYIPDKTSPQRKAYIVRSLKHPDEVALLRTIYSQGFYLIGVHADQERRTDYLTTFRLMSKEDAEALMTRDENEQLGHGQSTSDTFHISDFFVRLDGNGDRLRASVRRIVRLLFGHPYITPTFDEFAMSMAFHAALRSADLSRQVGAVIARNNEIIATGANDCPRFGGGLYWPELNPASHDYEDQPNGRDYKVGCDTNKAEQQKIIDDIVERARASISDEAAFRTAIAKGRVGDITEFGRMVHAEMEALLSCARSNASAREATLYCTTFPCHNCAKHIVAAGISRVCYVEPYPKSKASDFYPDSIKFGFSDDSAGIPKDRVIFEPFVGVGPRRFFDLFSMKLGSGYPLARKDADGNALAWSEDGAKLRTRLVPCSYLDLEIAASNRFNEYRKRSNGGQNA